MNTYTYKLPLTKSSTITIQILNDKNDPIYTMKRTYKTILHQLFDSWIGEYKLICEYEGRNQNGDLIVKSGIKHALIKRSESILVMGSDVFRAQIEHGDMITPTYNIAGSGVQLKVKIDFNQYVQFYENGIVIAKIQLNFLNKQKSELVIEELATIQCPLFYAIYAQMFYFVGEY
ncbi:hypothetical protein MKY51_14110 [Solibacillus sp. FSL R5-0691]|uniref:tubby C-terminal domain-like protein n=1 Tax=unclassified Solibacillus TaxID=2637870 RepID=UPI0030D0976C